MKLIDKALLDKIPTIFKSKVFLILFGYFIYLLFFNQYNLISQYKLFKELRTLNKEEAYYNDMIAQIKSEQKSIFKDQHSIEKFAREKYWMKKDSEEVYVFMSNEK